MTEDVMQQLTSVIALYSYDYVIPELSDPGSEEPENLDLESLVKGS